MSFNNDYNNNNSNINNLNNINNEDYQKIREKLKFNISEYIIKINNNKIQ